MLQPDTQLGAYRLLHRIGAGGMGEVWKAEDTRLGRIVAIKVLPPSVASDNEAVARMRREARTAAQLYHHNIATIHSIEQEGDRLFIVMEFVDGKPLSAVIRQGDLNEAEICRIGRGVADALAEAHSKGIIHRDIKPDNIIVSGNRVKVLDFGIAKQIGAVTTGDKPTTFMTQQGVIIGTIHYMSPEQALGKQLDARSDIFSLGVVLYEAATGRLPFRGETVTETMTQIIRDEPAEPRNLNPAISAEMQAIIDRCLRKNREERYATAEELVAALDAQLGRASTAPYTSSNAPTVARAAATVSTASSVKTVQESAPQQPIAPPPPQKRVNVATIVIIVALAVAVAALAIINRRNAQAANTTTVAAAPAPAPVVATQAPPPQPPTSTTVEVEEKKPAAAPPIVSAPAPAPAPVPEPVPAPAQTPDTLYATAVSQLQNGDAQEARKTLLEVVKLDPHYARAHFRLGEIALLNRRGDYALQELYLAQNDPDKLDPRERMLTDLGTAVVKKDREAARHLAREINTQWPDDPDLAHIVREYPGMFLGGALREERGPFRGRRRPGQ